MKMGKLMLTTALVTATLVGAFAESAEAQLGPRPGRPHSSSSQQDPELVLFFNLVTQTPELEPITDQAPDNEDVGLFLGAIEELSFGEEGGEIRDLEVADLRAEREMDRVVYTFLSNGEEILPSEEGIFTEDDLGFILDLNESVDDAINSLQFIFENDLLVEAFYFNLGEDIIFSRPISPSEPIPVPEPIPESNPAHSLLALGILGTGVFLKRKMKQING